jgi:hypothetical protein
VGGSPRRGLHDEAWATSRSRAPHTSPSRTPDELRQLILDNRARLVANPRAQYGALAIAWELRHMGVEPIPERWTIEREIARAGLARPRRRQPGYVPKGVPLSFSMTDSSSKSFSSASLLLRASRYTRRPTGTTGRVVPP